MLPNLVALPMLRLDSSAATLLVSVALLLILASLLALFHGRLRSAAAGAIGIAVVALFALLHWDQSLQSSWLPLRSYGALLGIAVIAGTTVTLRSSSLVGGERSLDLLLAVLALLGGLFVAHLAYSLIHPAATTSLWSLVALRQGGLLFAPGLVMAVALVGWWMRGQPRGLLRWSDAAAPALACGAVLVSLGSYLHGSGYGALLARGPSWLDRLGTFPRWSRELEASYGSGSPAWFDQVASGAIAVETDAALPVHPVQLYEACWFIGAAALGILVSRRRRFFGEVSASVLVPALVGEFFLGFLRGDVQRGLLGPAVAPGTAGALLVGVLFIGPALWLWRRRKLSFPELRVAAFAGALLGLSIWGGGRFLDPAPQQLSVSQWIDALVSPVFVGLWAWRRFDPKISV